MTSQSRNLDSLIPDDVRETTYVSLRDIFGVVLNFTGVSFVKDDKGYKATFTANRPDDPKALYISTRAIQPLKVGSYAAKNKIFPFTAKFITKGQAVMLVDPTVEGEASNATDIPY